MELSNLPSDLVEEILSKLPVTSHMATRLTCKNLNKIFDEEKHISEEEPMVMMVMDYKVYLMDLNLHDPSIKRKGKLISLNGLDDHVAAISKIVHCDGLLLCVMKYGNKKLVVWNPYLGESRWIEPTKPYQISDHYTIGYQQNGSCRINKILRFSYGCDEDGRISRCEIYNLKTNSWRVFDITPPKSYLSPYSVSLKGNTYWLATETRYGDIFHLICFDFTRERFGSHLLLPHLYYFIKHHVEVDVALDVALSSVREEQLVVLIQHSCRVGIWVTSNIEPKKVSWNKMFLQAREAVPRDLARSSWCPLNQITRVIKKKDMTPFIGHHRLRTSFRGVDFFINEEKKIAVVMTKNEDYTRHIAYIIGKNGYFRQVDLGEVTDRLCKSCFVHIKKPERKQIRRSYFRRFLRLLLCSHIKKT